MPRLSSVLTVVVLMMAAISVLTYQLGIGAGLSVALFPMVILTMTIERMSIGWEEAGPREALQQAAGSLLAASLAYLVMTERQVQHLVFTFPELLLIVLAITLAMGRYTGYRLTELRALQGTGGMMRCSPGSAHGRCARRRARHEPAQRRLHRPGQPAPPVPAGGRQGAHQDAGPGRRHPRAGAVRRDRASSTRSCKLPKLLEGREDFVVKPVNGSGGNGVLVIVGHRKGRYRKASGSQLTEDELEHHVSNILSGLYSLGGQPDAAMIEYRVKIDPVFEPISLPGRAGPAHRGLPGLPGAGHGAPADARCRTARPTCTRAPSAPASTSPAA